MCEECGCGQSSTICPECGASMILINGEPVCPACGGESHADHAHDAHGHDEHHHHAGGHTHHHEEGQHSAEDLIRLRLLVPHWIEHNQDHATGFRDWAKTAREAGLESVAGKIEAAAIQMEACNRILSLALEDLDEA
jgi:hypothetical protein